MNPDELRDALDAHARSVTPDTDAAWRSFAAGQSSADPAGRGHSPRRTVVRRYAGPILAAAVVAGIAATSFTLLRSTDDGLGTGGPGDGGAAAPCPTVSTLGIPSAAALTERPTIAAESTDTAAPRAWSTTITVTAQPGADSASATDLPLAVSSAPVETGIGAAPTASTSVADESAPANTTEVATSAPPVTGRPPTSAPTAEAPDVSATEPTVSEPTATDTRPTLEPVSSAPATVAPTAGAEPVVPTLSAEVAPEVSTIVDCDPATSTPAPVTTDPVLPASSAPDATATLAPESTPAVAPPSRSASDVPGPSTSSERQTTPEMESWVRGTDPWAASVCTRQGDQATLTVGGAESTVTTTGSVACFDTESSLDAIAISAFGIETSWTTTDTSFVLWGVAPQDLGITSVIVSINDSSNVVTTTEIDKIDAFAITAPCDSSVSVTGLDSAGNEVVTTTSPKACVKVGPVGPPSSTTSAPATR
ncbi:hypothetical protein GIS00_25970 [Nakamurella sp. YIM 132087]|uniref:Uncharacterized protein n=1 Tax=Nakamurella alba TaxID=2665158 RepID=A0A7K1FVZ2_9ACTN|nr:hypothetical protein [Nakamurella alba]MTD17383.1 hypothetical protein [Nakamurella alba]